MKPRHLYLGLCLVGLLLPNSLFFPWIVEHGLSPQRFVQDLFANGVSAFFGVRANAHGPWRRLAMPL